MKKKRKGNNKKIVKHNFGFAGMLIFIIFSLVSAILFALLNNREQWLCFNNAFNNNLGIACQIINGIMCCILPILGLSISLQQNKFLGIAISSLYQMRNKKRFDFKSGSIISILLMLFSTVGYITNQLLFCIASAFVLMVFDMYLIITEVPYLTVQESAMIKIIKDRYIDIYNGEVKADNYQGKEFNDVLFALIRNKNLRWVYERLKLENNQEYNKDLLYKLMDIQSNQAFHLDKIETKSELVAITDEFLETICSMVLGNFDIVEVLGENVKDYLHLLTRVLFRLLENPISKEKTEKSIAKLVTSFYVPKGNKNPQRDLFFSVITILILGKIKQGDFSLANEVKKELSLSLYFLRKSCMESRIFIMISFIMYYLAEKEREFPKEFKDKIIAFINEQGIDDNVEKYSWKKLFAEFSRNFDVSLDDFLSDLSKNNYHYQFNINSCRAHSIILTKELAFDWYLANLFNSYKKPNSYDYDKMIQINDDEFVYHLKQLQNECYSEQSREFISSDRFNKLASFYIDGEPKFSLFKIVENHSHLFRNYIDSLRMKEFEEKINNASNVSVENIVEKHQTALSNKIKSCFGYNDNIDLKDAKKLYFAMIDEKSSCAINFDECIEEWAIRNIEHEIMSNFIELNSKIIKADQNFESEISNLTDIEIAYATNDVKYYYDYIKDVNIRERFRKKIDSVTIIESNYFFYKPTLILSNGFAFNCNAQFEAIELSDEQVNKQVEQYMRSDGQYVYEDAFVTREELFKIIKNTKIIYRVIFNYKAVTRQDGIIILNMYPDIDNDTN